MARWLGELDEIGWPPRKINQRLRIVQERQFLPIRSLSDKARGEVVEGLIGAGGPLAKRKVFTRADIVRVAGPLLYGYQAEELDRVVTSVVEHPEAIPLVGQAGARGRAWAAASVLATEQAIEAVAARLAERKEAAVVHRERVQAAVEAKEAALGRALTDGQRRAASTLATSGRALDLVVGVAGSGKTTALEVVRTAFESEGYRVLGAAISGQAARALREGSGVESRTVASLVWRLEHSKMSLDDRTVLLIDEAGMTDDAAMLKLLAAVDVAGAKAVVVGDHRQLGAVDPGGGLEALINRHGDAVLVLDENIRQRDPGERAALEHLRSGDVQQAVDWYRANGRIVTAPTRATVLDAAVDAWEADVTAGHETVLLAWRRRDVAALNERARMRRIAVGAVAGPELEAPGGRHYAAGDRVVILAPSATGRLVTSERGAVVVVGESSLEIQFDDGRRDVLSGRQLDSAHLDHAYALTVHRTQGATVDCAHVLADGGGRELAYVALSRARERTRVYILDDRQTPVVQGLAREWATSHRERWVLDEFLRSTCGGRVDGDLRSSAVSVLRAAHLRAERDAIRAVTSEPVQRLASIEAFLRMEGRGPRPLSTTPRRVVR